MSILRKIFYFLLDALQTILVAAAIFLVIYQFLFRPFQVNGASMYPTFENGENILTNLITLRLNEPSRGDVIVFHAPPEQEKDFIKRVIGTAGDTVMVQDGKVYLNNELLDESVYLDPAVQTNGGAFLRSGESKTVPVGNYFVMGDNRPNSSDSREWGFVPKEKLIGKSWIVYWPLNKLQVVGNPYK